MTLSPNDKVCSYQIMLRTYMHVVNKFGSNEKTTVLAKCWQSQCTVNTLECYLLY